MFSAENLSFDRFLRISDKENLRLVNTATRRIYLFFMSGTYEFYFVTLTYSLL